MNTIRRQSGQALVTLLFFTIIATLLTSAAIVVVVVNAKSTNQVMQANISRSIAESGVENALLRLLRNPSYTGETMTLNGGTAVVQVSQSGSTYTITSTGTNNNFVSTMQATATVTNDTMSVTSWKEL